MWKHGRNVPASAVPERFRAVVKLPSRPLHRSTQEFRSSSQRGFDRQDGRTGGLHCGKDSPQGRLVSQITIVQEKALPIDLFLPPQIFDSRAKDIARSSYNAVYDVSLF